MLISLTHVATPQFKLCIKRCSDSSSDDSIELLLGYKVGSTYARVSVGDLPLNEEYDGIVSKKDGFLEIKIGTSKEATVAIQHDRGIETLVVCMRNVRDQIMVTKT